MGFDLIWMARVNAHATSCEHIELVEHGQDFGVGLVDGGDDGEVVRVRQFAQTGNDLDGMDVRKGVIMI